MRDTGSSDRRLEALPRVDRWPTREEAAGSLWFSPLRLGASLTAATRTWVPAMVPWRATEDGFVSDAVVEWYARFAMGRPGVLVVEATGIRDVPSGPLLRIGDERYVPGLRRLVDAVREASGGETRLLIQLIDFLAIKRRPAKATYFARFFRPEPDLAAKAEALTGDPSWREASEAQVRERLADAPDDLLEALLRERELESLRMGHRERVTDLHLPHVRDLPLTLPSLFADAAARAKEAGFDGVELHYAHAYTMASFLSARNTRGDGYGGGPEGRMRLPLEVFAKVRERVGEAFCVGCRILGDEVIDGGSRVEDAARFAVAFARAGFDFLSISKGGKFEDARQPKEGAAAYPYTGPSGHECMPPVRIDERGPFERNVGLAAALRRAVRGAGFETPVIAAGGISTFDAAEGILRRGDADAVASARQTLADPDWFRKVRSGRGEEVRRCFFTNYCEALDQAHKEVTCQRWDRVLTESEGDVPRTKDGRRRLTPPVWQP